MAQPLIWLTMTDINNESVKIVGFYDKILFPRQLMLTVIVCFFVGTGAEKAELEQ